VLVLVIMTPFMLRPLWRNRELIRRHFWNWRLALMSMVVAS